MKYLKKYDEGFIDWIKGKLTPNELEDTDDNKIAKGIIKTILPVVDPENIQYVEAGSDNNYTESITLKLGGGSNLYITRKFSFYVLNVDEDLIDCRDNRVDYKRIIFETLLKQYKDVQARIRYQRISTNVGL